MCSVCGVLVSGFVAAIPVVTRGLAFLFAPLQTAAFRGWYQVPPLGAGQLVSIALFVLVLALGLLRPRFWCRYVCPTGAVFSTTHMLRLFERTVDQTCTDCDRCRKICPFDAIHDDYTTRVADCTLCRTCGGVCPVGAIHYVPRWNTTNEKSSIPSCGADISSDQRGDACDDGAVGCVAAPRIPRTLGRRGCGDRGRNRRGGTHQGLRGAV